MPNEIPTYKRQQTDTGVNYSAEGSGIIQEQANATQRLQARLSNNVSQVGQLAAPIITEETRNKALEDVKSGNINSEAVSKVAQDVYRKTAEASFYADVEVGAKTLGNNIVNEQTLSGNYNLNAVTKSWDEYIKGTTQSIKDITVKTNIENRLSKMGQQFQTQVATLQTKQQRTIQQKNLKAKLEMDTDELKKAIGVNPERVIELQTEIKSNITTLSDGNFITPAEADTLYKDINKQVVMENTQKDFKKSLAMGLDKATDFVEKFDKSKQPLLDETEKLKTLNSFKSQMSDLRRDIKTQTTVTIKQNTVSVDDGIKVLNNLQVPDNMLELDEMVKTLPLKKQDQYNTAKIVQSEMSKFSDKTLPEMEAYINSSEAKEISTKLGVEVLDEAKKVLAKKQKMAKSDPISLAIQDGIIEQPQAVSVTDLTGLNERLNLSAVTQEQYGTTGRLLTDIEANEFTDYMDNPDTTITQKQLLIANINTYGTEIAESLYRQVGGKGAYSLAFNGELSMMGNSKGAKLALQGHGLDVVLDSKIKGDIQTALKGVFSNFNANYYNQNLKGLMDYVKGATAFPSDVDVTVAKDVIKATIGLPVSYNNKQTILPYGVSQGDFETYLDNIEIPDRPDLTEGLQDMTDTLGSGDYQLHYAGPGKYLVYVKNNGSGYYATATDDVTKPFILDWNK